jgi:hypothetical protein
LGTVDMVKKINNASVKDEVCPNDEYYSKLERTEKKKCSINM